MSRNEKLREDNVKAAVVLLAMIVATAGAFYVVWLNRASEKIITAVFPISVAALVGIFLSIFVFGAETTTTVRFPVVFLFRSADRMPVDPPYRPLLNSLFEVPELQKDHPDLMADDTGGATLYHHLLQRSIVDTIAWWHSSSWETEIDRFDIGGTEEMGRVPPNASGESEKISIAELQRKLTGNRFAGSRFRLMPLTLPPDTEVEIKPPIQTPQTGEEGRIVFSNKFVRLTITTQSSSWMVGLGPYRQLMGYSFDESQANCKQAQYLVTVNAEYSRLRSGHPDMARYQRWVQQITSEIRRELDEQEIWARTKDSFTFARQLDTFPVVKAPVPPLTLNPPQYP